MVSGGQEKRAHHSTSATRESSKTKKSPHLPFLPSSFSPAMPGQAEKPQVDWPRSFNKCNNNAQVKLRRGPLAQVDKKASCPCCLSRHFEHPVTYFWQGFRTWVQVPSRNSSASSPAGRRASPRAVESEDYRRRSNDRSLFCLDGQHRNAPSPFSLSSSPAPAPSG